MNQTAASIGSNSLPADTAISIARGRSTCRVLESASSRDLLSALTAL
jgi:hypothetical protein